MKYLQAVRSFSRNTKLYLAIWPLVGFGYFGVFSVLFNLYIVRLGLGPSAVGLAHGVGWFAVAVFSLPAGWLGKRVSQRALIISGLVASALAFALIPVTELLPKSIWPVWIALANGMAGLFGSVFMVNGPPFLMANTAESKREYSFSVQVAAAPLFGFGGNLVAGFLPGLIAMGLSVGLDRPEPYRYPLLLVPVSYAIAAIIMLATTSGASADKSTQRLPPEKTEAHVVRLIVLVAVVNFLRSGGAWIARIYFNIYMDMNLRASTGLIGTIIAVAQLTAIPAALLMPLFNDKTGRRGTILFSILVAGTALLILAVLPNKLAASAGYILVVGISSLGNAAFAIYSQELVSPSARSLMAGAVITAMGLGVSAAAYGGGRLMSVAGPKALFLVAVGLMVLGAAVLFMLPRQTLQATGTRRT